MIWTNGQIRSLLRAISIIENGEFMEMLDEQNKENQKVDITHKNGWLAVHRLFLLEYPQSKFTAEDLADKYWNLSVNPGSIERKSIFELMLLYKESTNKHGNQIIVQQQFIGENGEIKFLKMELDEIESDFQNSDSFSPKQESKSNKYIKNETKNKELNQSLPKSNKNSKHSQILKLNKEKEELEINILELERDTQKKKLLVWETMKQKIELDDFNYELLMK